MCPRNGAGFEIVAVRASDIAAAGVRERIWGGGCVGGGVFAYSGAVCSAAAPGRRAPAGAGRRAGGGRGGGSWPPWPPPPRPAPPPPSPRATPAPPARPPSAPAPPAAPRQTLYVPIPPSHEGRWGGGGGGTTEAWIVDCLRGFRFATVTVSCMAWMWQLFPATATGIPVRPCCSTSH